MKGICELWRPGSDPPITLRQEELTYGSKKAQFGYEVFVIFPEGIDMAGKKDDVAPKTSLCSRLQGDVSIAKQGNRTDALVSPPSNTEPEL